MNAVMTEKEGKNIGTNIHRNMDIQVGDQPNAGFAGFSIMGK